MSVARVVVKMWRDDDPDWTPASESLSDAQRALRELRDELWRARRQLAVVMVAALVVMEAVLLATGWGS